MRPKAGATTASRFYACHFITPVDADTCIDHWLFVKNFPTDAATSQAMIEQFRIAFNEDKVILEAIQRSEKEPRSWRPVKLAIDAGTVRMRRMVEQMIEDGRDIHRGAAPPPHETSRFAEPAVRAALARSTRGTAMLVRSSAVAICVAMLAVEAAHAQGTIQGTIKIGDINSYKAMASNMGPYRKGVDLAVEEINAAGGVLGKKLEIVTRDDGANPGDAVRMADELYLKEKVDILSGTILSHVGLAVADYARQRKTFFLASAPLTDKIVWESGNRYTFRLRPSTYTHAAVLVPHAVKLNRKRWAFIYPNYEYGQSAVATFKELFKKAQPDVEFVADLAPPLGKIDAGAVVQALAEAKPDAIFNVLFGADLAKFAREGKTRDLFKSIEVVSLLDGRARIPRSAQGRRARRTGT